MTSEDPRRKLIDEAMEAMEDAAAQTDPYLHKVKGIGCRDKAHIALPAAVELIEELTAKAASQRDMFNFTRHRVIERMGEPDLGKSWSWIESTIAEQAKEIERLKTFVERCSIGEHPDEIPEEAQEMLNDQ